mgnify:FL=1
MLDLNKYLHTYIVIFQRIILHHLPAAHTHVSCVSNSWRKKLKPLSHKYNPLHGQVTFQHEKCLAML